MPITSFPTTTKEVVMLYNDTVRLEFSTEGHRYKIFHNGTELFGTKGVTTVIGIIDKPELLQWSANVANQTWVDGLKGKIPDELLIARLAKEAPVAWRVRRDTAGDIGTLIHVWIESYIKAKIDGTPIPDSPINPIIQGAVLKFLMWEKQNDIKFVASEKKVYSLKHNVAGICDFLYLNKDGKTCLGDIKTSKGIYKTFYLQLAAYKYMIQEENPSTQIEEMTIVRVGKDDAELEVKNINDYASNAKAFLACVILHNIMKPIKKY